MKIKDFKVRLLEKIYELIEKENIPISLEMIDLLFDIPEQKLFDNLTLFIIESNLLRAMDDFSDFINEGDYN